MKRKNVELCSSANAEITSMCRQDETRTTTTKKDTYTRRVQRLHSHTQRRGFCFCLIVCRAASFGRGGSPLLVDCLLSSVTGSQPVFGRLSAASIHDRSSYAFRFLLVVVHRRRFFHSTPLHHTPAPSPCKQATELTSTPIAPIITIRRERISETGAMRLPR